MVVRITSTPNGPQLFILNCRLHHFHCGMAAIAFGCWAILKDKRDFLDWLIR